MIQDPRRNPSLRAGPDAEEGYLVLATVATVLLVGSLAGMVLAYGDFTAPRLLLRQGAIALAVSGWGQLTFDGLLLALLLLATLWLHGVALRRVLFCLLASLLLHFWLAVGAHRVPAAGIAQAPLENRVEREVSSESESQLALNRTLPEYHWNRIDSPEETKEDFDQPVEAVPEQPAEQAQVEPKRAEPQLALQKLTPIELQRPEEKPEPHTPARAEIAAQDFDVSSPEIDRTETARQLEPDEPIPEPKVKQVEPLTVELLERPSPGDGRKLPSSSGPPFDGVGLDALPDLEAGRAEPSVTSMPRRVEALEPSIASATDARLLGRQHARSAPAIDVEQIKAPVPADSPSDISSGVPAVQPAPTDVGRTATGPEGIATRAAASGPGRSLAGLDVPVSDSGGPSGGSRIASRPLGVLGRGSLSETSIFPEGEPGVRVAKSGGAPVLEGGTGVDPKSFFQQRSPAKRGQISRTMGGNDATEAAVERGIDYLARYQFPAGNWSLDRFPQGNAADYQHASPGSMNADTAATGLALLALLGAGYTHTEGKQRTVIERGLGWLIANQQRDGRLFTPTTDRTRYGQSYGHAIATIALCEAFGMTGDQRLRDPAQRAINYIIASQHPDRGGWRYEPLRESDTSVSGWKLMALKSAQMAGLRVPTETVRRVSHWLDLAKSEGGSRYAYNPFASDTPAQREGRMANLAMTAEGLLMRMYLGWQRATPALADGAAWISANRPEVGTATAPKRDAYYWYYATQVMYQMQGPGWEAWNDQLKAVLLPSQVAEGPMSGSWEPMAPVPDRWGAIAGRHYVTTLHLLMLEVYYRHLPLYRQLKP